MTIDIARLVGAVSRELITREHEGKPARVLAASRTYDTSVEDLWDAMTNPTRLERWFLPVSGDLRLGGRYQLEGNAGGEITACDPPRHLALTWEIGGQTSWVAVRLQRERQATRLRLEHIAHVPDDFWNRYGPGATGVGWEHGLFGLDLHVAGDSISTTEAEAWLATQAGRSFTRRISEGWCEASIRAGTDEA
ncbi:MAG: SRPBCC family protein, partial [Myxococcales bacterium]|nr:SRPBCC family protein [Myxococcales bacterium]